MSKQLNLIRTSPQFKELMKASAELYDIARRLESQASDINRKEHPELMSKTFTFVQNWDIHVIGETQEGTQRYLTYEEIKRMYPEVQDKNKEEVKK